MKVCLIALVALASPVAAQTTIAIDPATLSHDVSVLAADSMEGRGAGTEGGARARRYLLRRFPEVGLQPPAAGWEMPFEIPGNPPRRGVNVLGVVPGTSSPDRWIVVTAHYDHLGVRNGTVYNGADDNASGVAGLLALAEYFAHERPAHSMMFVALDAEEMGLLGAEAFVEAPPIPLEDIALNVNLDMVGRNAAGELYVAGTSHYPALAPIVERVAADAPVRLIAGHDTPSARPSDDWTGASDHGAFHSKGIPFLYFGVEDHPDYHRPTDDFEGILKEFHAAAVETVRRALVAADATLR